MSSESTCDARTAKAQAQARHREKKKGYIQQLERKVAEYAISLQLMENKVSEYATSMKLMESKVEEYKNSLQLTERRAQEYATLFDALQVALGLSEDQLQALPAFLLQSWRCDRKHREEVAEVLGSLASLLHPLLQSKENPNRVPENGETDVMAQRPNIRTGDTDLYAQPDRDSEVTLTPTSPSASHGAFHANPHHYGRDGSKSGLSGTPSFTLRTPAFR